MRVTVLLGGASAERDVSLNSGVQVARALRRAGHEVVCVDPAAGPVGREEEQRLLEEGVGAVPPEPEASGAGQGGGSGLAPEFAAWPEVTGADAVFIALHGGPGEDGRVQALLDLAGVTYAGSGHLGCALAMEKDVSKRLFRQSGVPTAPWTLLPAPEAELGELGLPLVVKPTAGGSTLGLTVVDDRSGLEAARRRAAAFGGVMAEAFLDGREITVGVLEGEPLPVGEIIPEHDIFDYECKYQPGMAEEVFPAEIPDDAAARAQELAVRAHRALRLSGFSRVDFVLEDDGTCWCLEANALPGMTSTSLVPQAAAAAGIGFPELCDRIVRSAGEGG